MSSIRIQREGGKPHKSNRGRGEDLSNFELKVVQRAVQDEEDEIEGQQEAETQDNRGSPRQLRESPSPDQRRSSRRPKPNRQSSLLDRLVQDDRDAAAAAAGPSGSRSKPLPVPPRDSSKLRGSAPLSRSALTNDPEGQGQASQLTTLSEDATYIPPYPSHQQSLGRDSPSHDRARNLAPGPRARRPSDGALYQPNYSGGQASSSRVASLPSAGSSQRFADADAEQQDQPSQGPAAAEETAKSEGFFGALMRRGRSYTLPSSQRSDDPDIPKRTTSRQSSGAVKPREEVDTDDDLHEDGVVDYLDVVDPEVSALNHLSNIQSSIFMPNVTALWDNRLRHKLPSAQPSTRKSSLKKYNDNKRISQISTGSSSAADPSSAMEEGRAPSPTESRKTPRPGMMKRMASALSTSSKKPDPEAHKHFDHWVEMDEKERNELDAHVQHLLTRPQKFKRGLRGFGIWARTPMGFIMLFYGLSITGWGITIMLFIWKWIDLPNPARQRYWIEICDQVLCALFAAVGLGFAPFRAVDTWRMIHIAHYHRLSWRRRKEFNLPELEDRNDLPRPRGYNEAFPPAKPDGLGLITEEEAQEEHRRSLAVDRSSDTSSGQSSPRGSSRQLVSPTDPTSPQGPPAPLPQALANANVHKKDRKWYQRASRREKEAERKAAEAAMEAVHKTDSRSNADGSTNFSDNTSQSQCPSSYRSAAPKLQRQPSMISEIEKEKEDVVVLTPEEQSKLEHHQRAFRKSHGYFRYHSTASHDAFPLKLMVAIVILLDCHSLFQGALGGCTWGINYHRRPTALTATIITCSLSCNAAAGLLIYLGGRRTKRKEEVERRIHVALEEEAFALMMREQEEANLQNQQDAGATSGKRHLMKHYGHGHRGGGHNHHSKKGEMSEKNGQTSMAEEEAKQGGEALQESVLH